MPELVGGKYQVVKRLAVGGMGEIYLARETGGGLDRLVILKTLLADEGGRGDIAEFLDEARIAATLNHPNIVQVYEVGEQDGTPYIAMEYINGDNLARLLTRAEDQGMAFPVRLAARIVRDAAIGLDHAHHAADTSGNPLGIVHRDIGVQNIMVRADGVTKVVDFGIAKAANRATRTETGFVKGKLSYMSPEQVDGKPLDGRSDQFALGIVLWEMLTGQRLFKAASAFASIQKLVSEPIPPPSSVHPGVPPELEQITMRMLERDPDERFPRCAAAAEALDAFMASAGEPTGEPEVGRLVTELVGDALVERTRDLTPSPQAFTPPLIPAAATATTPMRHRKRRGLLVGVIAAAAFTSAVATWQVVNALDPGGTESPSVEPTQGQKPEVPTVVVGSGASVAEPEPPQPKPEPPQPKPDPPKPKPEPPKKPEPPPPEPKPGLGWLTVRTTPWTKITIDEAHREESPLSNFPLAAGRHVIRLVNKKAGVDTEREVIIEAGIKTKLDLKL